jgi:hypothetical protein
MEESGLALLIPESAGTKRVSGEVELYLVNEVQVWIGRGKEESGTGADCFQGCRRLSIPPLYHPLNRRRMKVC